MKGAACLRAFRSSLPRTAEAAEAVDHFLLGHPVTVVDDADLLDSVQSIPAKLDLDLVSIGVERIPDQLDQAGDRFRSAEPLKVLLVKLDVEIHGG